MSIVNQGRGPNQAFKSAVNRVVEEIFPDRMGKKLTLYESVSTICLSFLVKNLVLTLKLFVL